MSSEKKWLLFGAVGLIALLGFIFFTPKKEEFGRLWRKSIDAIEYEGPTGLVRLEKESGWFEDRFFITSSVNGKVIRRSGSPAVKGIFTEFEAPIVKGEYILDEAEAGKRFADAQCIRLFHGSSTDTLCAGRTQNALSPVRMPEDPQRVYLLPDHIFSRLSTDPAHYVEKRLIVMPAGTVPDRLRIIGPDRSVELFRKKQAAQAPDGSKIDAVHWFVKAKGGEEKEIAQPTVMNLLTTLYDMQRDEMLTEKETPGQPLYTIELDLVLEGPAAGSALQRTFGDRTLRLTLYNGELEGPNGTMIRAESEGVIDAVKKERFDRFVDRLSAIPTP